ncbi:protoporphyrinogen oxidase HemJ [Helicobacter cynogastricus]|uniref:protoporphyrinogen oxidase HemJ n=1 Tax=Helicobacter cynogastricus TaxID=329937 RepID=UPI000CF139EE|nr:protoporphyrinogen oxidase HemJ [Helicobacter cynogastricus]
MENWYLWIKIAHVIGVISWMAALFYLPRLFVYHREHHDKPEFVAIVCIQEQKLYQYIAMPAMILVVISGLALLYILGTEVFKHGWLHLKLLCVLILLHYHFMCGKFIRVLGQNGQHKSGRFFRWINEVPTICMIVIVFCAVGKFF